MVRLEKHGDSAVRFIFTDSDHYLYKDGVVDVPVNSLSLVIDESEMVTFKKASTGDPFISFRLDKSNFSSRDELLTFYKENMVGAGGISEEEVQEMIDAATSGIPSSEVVEQLRRDVNAVSGEVDTKQDILTAGENITISGNVISADAGNSIIELTQAEYDALETKDPEALYIITDAQEINMNDYYTKSEVDASINTKADASALTAVNNALTAHTANTTVHVTQTEKNTWNGKVDEGYVTDYAYSKNQIDGFLENATTLLQTISGEVDTKVDTTTYESGQYATAQALNALQENKLDASAYTPTDLSEYWTSAQTQSAIDAATSGIPSSQVIEQLRTDVNTLSGDVQTNAANIADLVDTIDEKEEVIASALTQLNQDVAEIDAKEEVIASALTEVNLTLDNKLDASAYTPTDLSEYWTSAQTQTAIDGVKAYFIDLDAIMTRGGLTDADWDGAIAAVNAHRPVYIKFYNDHFILESYSLTDNNNTMYLSASDGIAASRFTIIKNGSNDYSLDRAIRGFVTSAEKDAWNAKADASALTSIQSAVTAVSNDLNTLSGAVIDNEYTVSQAINELKSTKLDASAYTPTDLSEYWTSAQTQSAIDGVSNALTAHTANTTVHVTSAEKTAWNAKQDALSAGTGISISNNVISTSGVVMSQQVTQIIKLTQAQYDALSTKDAQTLYIVVD